MIKFTLLLLFVQLSFSAQIFNGNFNYYSTSKDFDAWSYNNQVGEWNTNIKGDGYPMSDYLYLSPNYKHPGDTVAKQGVACKINTTSHWSGQQYFLRTEITPNKFDKSANQNGVLYYQWSMKQGSDKPLNSSYTHRFVFMEPNYVSLNYGGSPVSSTNKLWLSTNDDKNIITSIPFTLDTWLNFALKVDFTNQKIALFTSTGNQNLAQTVADTSAQTNGNSDFHLGHLRFGYNYGTYQDEKEEFLYYSSISIQRDSYVNSVSGAITPTPPPSTPSTPPSTPPPSSPPSTPAATSTSSSASPSCETGAKGCTCTPGGGCDPGLRCVDNFCLLPAATGSNAINSGAVCGISMVLIVIATLF